MIRAGSATARLLPFLALVLATVSACGSAIPPDRRVVEGDPLRGVPGAHRPYAAGNRVRRQRRELHAAGERAGQRLPVQLHRHLLRHHARPAPAQYLFLRQLSQVQPMT